MQRMTDFCQIVSMSRLFNTLEKRVFQYPTLRNPEKGGGLRDTSVQWTFLTASRHSSNEFGSALDFATLLRFSLFEAVKKSVRYIIRAINIVNQRVSIERKALTGYF